jgi:hypothetical protein
MLSKCLQKIAEEWFDIIMAFLGNGSVSNYLGSFAAILAIVIGLVQLGFGGKAGPALVRAMVLFVVLVLLIYAITAQGAVIQQMRNQVQKCLKNSISPPITAITVWRISRLRQLENGG